MSSLNPEYEVDSLSPFFARSDQLQIATAFLFDDIKLSFLLTFRLLKIPKNQCFTRSSPSGHGGGEAQMEPTICDLALLVRTGYQQVIEVTPVSVPGSAAPRGLCNEWSAGHENWYGVRNQCFLKHIRERKFSFHYFSIFGAVSPATQCAKSVKITKNQVFRPPTGFC